MKRENLNRRERITWYYGGLELVGGKVKHIFFLKQEISSSIQPKNVGMENNWELTTDSRTLFGQV